MPLDQGPSIQTSDTIYAVLCVSPFRDDYETLERFLSGGNWTIHHASTLCGAKHLLKSNSYRLVICERDMPPDSWKDVLVEAAALPSAPFFLVTSLHADDALWAEALNWGAYDVLTKPFQQADVVRALNMAALHWNYRHDLAKPLVRRAGR